MRISSYPRFDERGFSLIELLLVLVIIGLLASIAIPSLVSTRDAAEAGSTISTLRTIQANQSNFFFQKGRYARLSELNSYADDSLGTMVGSVMHRGNYRFYSFPNTDSSLKTRFTILAIRYRKGFAISAYVMREDGVVRVIL